MIRGYLLVILRAMRNSISQLDSSESTRNTRGAEFINRQLDKLGSELAQLSGNTSTHYPWVFYSTNYVSARPSPRPKVDRCTKPQRKGSSDVNRTTANSRIQACERPPLPLRQTHDYMSRCQVEVESSQLHHFYYERG